MNVVYLHLSTSCPVFITLHCVVLRLGFGQRVRISPISTMARWKIQLDRFAVFFFRGEHSSFNTDYKSDKLGLQLDFEVSEWCLYNLIAPTNTD